MKKYISLQFIVAVTLLFVGCKKNDGFLDEDYIAVLQEVPAISTAIDPTGNQAIDVLNLGAFQGKFTVKSYFTSKPGPTKIDIVVRKNGANTNVKLFQANVTTYPSTFTITSAQLAALFGTPVVLGDSYDFAADLYVGDKKYEAFPTVGVGNGSGPINMIGFSEYARFAAICAYDPAIYEGNFVVVSDAFGELAAGTIVPLTRVTNTSFRVAYPNPALTPQPTSFLATVNTLNNAVTVAQQQIGTNFYQYTNPTVETSGTTSNVTPCDKEIRIAIIYRVAQGSFGGPYTLRLRKQ